MTSRDKPLLKLTEFAPIEDEEKQSSVSQYLSSFFSKFSKTSPQGPSEVKTPDKSPETKPEIDDDCISSASTDTGSQVVAGEGRSLPNVMKRVSNLLALKNTNLQAYSDTELRRYWMPDHGAKECFECSEKFTTWRRRHHCRLCGQIFCSRCCSQELPGKLMGCTGDLRVCMYCCNIVLSYLPASNIAGEMSPDIRALLENLQAKYGTGNFMTGSDVSSISSSSTIYPSGSISNLSSVGLETETTVRRKVSVGYQEEKFGRPSNKQTAFAEERCRALQNSSSLRMLYEDICSNTNIAPSNGNDRKLNLAFHRYRSKNYNQCFPGSQLVDWLINHDHAKSRVAATALGQALLEAGYLEVAIESPAAYTPTNQPSFSDSPINFYRPCAPSELTFELPPLRTSKDDRNDKHKHEPAEPKWVQQIPQDGGTTTDSEAESHTSPPITQSGTRMPSSSSSFYLDLDLEASTVHLLRPLTSKTSSDGLSPTTLEEPVKDDPVLKSSEEHEIAPVSGWHNAVQLREENGEAEAYKLLNEAWKRHENALVAQFLNKNGLSLSWMGTILSITNEVIDFVRPDMYHDADIIDIREYVRIKTVPGGDTGRNECRVIRGIVCSKNVAHACMQGRRIQPRILLLSCPLVYQRNVGKYMALEPVLLQEHEYLRHATARILAMKPNIVLVAKNASRLAQDLLGEAGVALVTNVKNSVIERIARASNAEVVPSIDAANVGRRSWKLATCQEFYTHKFKEDEYFSKTLMFFEGLPASHLACTVILRGAYKLELRKLKQVTHQMIFARYNWRLEHSFLMDEFAKPPIPKNDFFTSSKENSPKNLLPKPQTLEISTTEDVFQPKPEESISVSTACKTSHKEECSPECKVEISIVNKFSEVVNDPLQCFEGNFDDDNNSDLLAVTEMPIRNRFKKALDDTLLSYSPFLTFSIPFLETEVGRNCKLRRFFPKEVYYSTQFLENGSKNIISFKQQKSLDQKDIINENIYKGPSENEFITSKITSDISNENYQTMLAYYRSCGGRLTHKPYNKTLAKKTNYKPIPEPPDTPSYVLDLNNHQRLAVLFCSFSSESNNSPAFCVDPSTKEMHFYGVMDAALGNFLEQYCFRESYKCISESCVTPMFKHTRRFVHHNGCITLKLNQLETNISDGNIVMWNWCTKCNNVSPTVPMSTDTWSFSFAKFLELKVHGYMYGWRSKGQICNHSVHHDHVHYFGCGNIVASFFYKSVELLELSIPPHRIEIKYNATTQLDAIIDEMKVLTLKGYDVYAAILDKLLTLPPELPEIPDLRQLLSKQQGNFKSKIEEVQLKITSPTFENKKFDKSDVSDIIWKLEDSVVNVKRLIAEVCDFWNSRLSEILNRTTTKRPGYSKSISVQDMPLNKSNLSVLPVEEYEGSSSPDVEVISPDRNVIDVASEDAFVFPGNEGKNYSGRRDSDEVMIDDCKQTDTSTDESQPETRKDSNTQHDKRTVKTLISQFLASPAPTLISSPLGATEHPLLPLNKDIPIVVYENEPSSIIAYALTTQEYKKSLEDVTRCKSARTSQISQKIDICGSPGTRRKFTTSDNDTEDTDITIASSDNKNQKSSHIDVQFQDNKADFMVRVHYAEQFANLRNTVLSKETEIVNSCSSDIDECEERYIRSLSRSVQWTARGGKSGSFFCKTKDDRFILKEMSTQEMDKFLVFAPNFFDYLNNCLTTSQPTLLGKIIGVYRVCFKTASNSEKKNFLVMENLFYERPVTQKFDLKGSVRNRHVNIDEQDSEIVLLDENLLKMTCKSPLYIYPHSKTVLTTAILRDTEFLAAHSVMDYSLLVGHDPHTKELVVGIIDYIRTFTWDKKIETIVKKSGLLGGQGKLPTIISPDEYRNRFILAMHRYFLPVPGRWYGLNTKA